MVAHQVALRLGVAPDAVPLTALYLRSKSAAMPWLSTVHDEAETLWWMTQVVLAEQCVIVAAVGDTRLGFAALHGQWLQQLYVEPAAQGLGVGRALFEAVADARPDGFSLRTFTRNTRARLFYEALGCTLIRQSDGYRNEENEPDCTYSYGPAALPTDIWHHGDSMMGRDAGL